jgi:uncharacterized protein YukE
MSFTGDEYDELLNVARNLSRNLGRVANAVESIARAFEPAQDSLDAGPAKPDVAGVQLADD